MWNFCLILLQQTSVLLILFNAAVGKEDSASCQWIEQKDDLIQPVSGFSFALL